MEKPQFVYTTYIATTPEKLWRALTDPEFTEQYWSACRIESEWKVGASVVLSRDGVVHTDGEVLVCEPPWRLSYTWTVRNVPGMDSEGASRVLFEVEQLGDDVRLTVTHDRLVPDGKVLELISGGWPIVLSNLKSLLETGHALKLTRRDGELVYGPPSGSC